jgi:hypothetical protein
MRQEKTKEEYEYERDKDHCTFQPKLQNAAPKRNITPGHHQASASQADRGVQKEIDRMNKAREERKRVQKFTERGEVMPHELVTKGPNADLMQDES